MSYNTYSSGRPSYRTNGAWANCQRCPKVVRHDEIVREWDGLYVCKSCCDPVPMLNRLPISTVGEGANVQPILRPLEDRPVCNIVADISLLNWDSPPTT